MVTHWAQHAQSRALGRDLLDFGVRYVGALDFSAFSTFASLVVQPCRACRGATWPQYTSRR